MKIRLQHFVTVRVFHLACVTFAKDNVKMQKL